MDKDRNADEWGQWAFDARKAIGLSALDVAADLHVERTVIVKAEGRQRSRQMRKDLPRYLFQKAAEQGITLPPVPGSVPAEPALAPTGDLATLVALVTAQQTQIAALTKAVEQLTTAISTDRQGPPWVDDFAPALAGYIVSGLQAPRRRASEQ